MVCAKKFAKNPKHSQKGRRQHGPRSIPCRVSEWEQKPTALRNGKFEKARRWQPVTGQLPPPSRFPPLDKTIRYRQARGTFASPPNPPSHTATLPQLTTRDLDFVQTQPPLVLATSLYLLPYLLRCPPWDHVFVRKSQKKRIKNEKPKINPCASALMKC